MELCASGFGPQLAVPLIWTFFPFQNFSEILSQTAPAHGRLRYKQRADEEGREVSRTPRSSGTMDGIATRVHILMSGPTVGDTGSKYFPLRPAAPYEAGHKAALNDEAVLQAHRSESGRQSDGTRRPPAAKRCSGVDRRTIQQHTMVDGPKQRPEMGPDSSDMKRSRGKCCPPGTSAIRLSVCTALTSITLAVSAIVGHRSAAGAGRLEPLQGVVEIADGRAEQQLPGSGQDYRAEVIQYLRSLDAF